jgi:mRNA-degrading endonuclease RelE of RelBE toxin-antitoxin system
MNFDVVATAPFERKLKQLAKKYPSISDDLFAVAEELAQNPTLGIPLGKNCYKIRMAITSKTKGKSGGARLITYVRVLKNTVYLMDIYDKSELSTISIVELQMVIESLS